MSKLDYQILHFTRANTIMFTNIFQLAFTTQCK